MPVRMRDKRKTQAIRDKHSETRLKAKDFVYPVFIIEGKNIIEPIASMPGQSRFSVDQLLPVAKKAKSLGIEGLALFPKIADAKKDAYATHSKDFNNVLCEAIQALKKEVPDLTLYSDVAMDPYSTDGHDGLVKNGEILNDETLPILAEMAIVQAQAGVDYVAPSDMMDFRIEYIRKALDKQGYKKTKIMAYSAKYASHFYGPFRDALDSAPKSGDKKTYQMDFRNIKEALKEVALDVKEGADIVMVKPALCYLDVIHAVSESFRKPVAAYNVSGEYSMIKAAAARGWLDEKHAAIESLTAIRRAGAKHIFTYWALDAATWLKS